MYKLLLQHGASAAGGYAIGTWGVLCSVKNSEIRQTLNTRTDPPQRVNEELLLSYAELLLRYKADVMLGYVAANGAGLDRVASLIRNHEASEKFKELHVLSANVGRMSRSHAPRPITHAHAFLLNRTKMFILICSFFRL